MGPLEAMLTLTVSIRTIDSSVMERCRLQVASSRTRPLSAACRRCAALTLIHTAQAARLQHPGTNTTTACRFLDLCYLLIWLKLISGIALSFFLLFFLTLFSFFLKQHIQCQRQKKQVCRLSIFLTPPHPPLQNKTRLIVQQHLK